MSEMELAVLESQVTEKSQFLNFESQKWIQNRIVTNHEDSLLPQMLDLLLVRKSSGASSPIVTSHLRVMFL